MTYMTDRDRAPHAQEVLESPLHVEVRPGSDRVAAWANADQAFQLTTLGYTTVDPKDVELMQGGQYYPRDKDFGVYFEFDKKGTQIRVGQHVLMSIPRRAREARLAREAEKAASLRPKTTDKAEVTTRDELGEATTLKDEIK